MTIEEALPAAEEVCRETYDRFMMGGWEPRDAHEEVAAIISRRVQEWERSQWHDASKELPKKQVYSFLTRTEEGFIEIATFAGESFWIEGEPVDVTDWREIPEAPKPSWTLPTRNAQAKS